MAACAALFLVTAAPAAAQSFGGAFEGMSDSNQPIQIEADKLEILDAQGLATFNGNVNVVQGSTILKAGNLKVFYFSGGSSKIKRIEAGGKVAVRSGDQLATSDRAVFDMGAQVVTLTGDVSVSQGNNIVTGCALRVNLKTNAAKLEPCKGAGRVKMLFTPNSKTN